MGSERKASRHRRVLPDAVFLRECFDYDPATGVLTWKVRPLHHFCDLRAQKIWNTKNAGNGPPEYKDGYLYFQMRQFGGSLAAHCIIWKLVTGADPDNEIDHDDRVKSNNRWSNLRSANRSQNMANIGVSTRNSSGFKGVSLLPHGRWRAQISRPGSSHIGVFDTKEEALAAYEAAALAQWGKFYKRQEAA